MIKNEKLELSENFKNYIDKYTYSKQSASQFYFDLNSSTCEFGRKYYAVLDKKLKAFYLKKIIFAYNEKSAYNVVTTADNKTYILLIKYGVKIFDTVENYNNYIRTNNEKYLSKFSQCRIYDIVSKLFGDNLDYYNDGRYDYKNRHSLMVYCWGSSNKLYYHPIGFKYLWIDNDNTMHYEFMDDENVSKEYLTKEECIKDNMPQVLDFDDDNCNANKEKVFVINLTVNIKSDTEDNAKKKIEDVLKTLTLN